MKKIDKQSIPNVMSLFMMVKSTLKCLRDIKHLPVLITY